MNCPNFEEENSEDAQALETRAVQSVRRVESYIRDDDPLLGFLDRASKLEEAKYALEELYSRLEGRIASLGNPCEIREPKKDSFLGGLLGGLFLLSVPVTVIILLLRGGSSFRAITKAPAEFYVVMLLFLIPSVISLVSTAFTIHGNRKSKRNYRQAVQADRERVSSEQSVIEGLRDQESAVSDRYDELVEQLGKLYGLGMVYKKYCSFVAVTTILEYLQSGRCTRLTGSDGAYNLYEQELWNQTIVGKLDQVLNDLESIRENQYVLYDAIADACNACKSIEQQNERLIDSNQSVSSNSGLSVYLGQVSALSADTSVYVGQRVDL